MGPNINIITACNHPHFPPSREVLAGATREGAGRTTTSDQYGLMPNMPTTKPPITAYQCLIAGM